MTNMTICTKKDSTRTKKVNSRRPRTLSQERNEEMVGVQIPHLFSTPKAAQGEPFPEVKPKVERA
jgi:hypothetical protein